MRAFLKRLRARIEANDSTAGIPAWQYGVLREPAQPVARPLKRCCLEHLEQCGERP
jgi:hypothetical protein